MTQVDVVYRYAAVPTEAAAMALGKLREVYGIRRVQMQQLEKTVLVEFDSTRLTEPIVHQLLRRAGLDITERIPMFKVPPPVQPAV